MQTKPLLYGLIGFFLGGLLVSVAATSFDKPQPQGKTMSEMTASLADKQGGSYDQAFISQMIEHHEGALEMAKLSESRAEHTEIKQLSKDIISAQEREIDLMKQWRATWGYEQTENSHPRH